MADPRTARASHGAGRRVRVGAGVLHQLGKAAIDQAPDAVGQVVVLLGWRSGARPAGSGASAVSARRAAPATGCARSSLSSPSPSAEYGAFCRRRCGSGEVGASAEAGGPRSWCGYVITRCRRPPGTRERPPATPRRSGGTRGAGHPAHHRSISRPRRPRDTEYRANFGRSRGGPAGGGMMCPDRGNDVIESPATSGASKGEGVAEHGAREGARMRLGRRLVGSFALSAVGITAAGGRPPIW
jgi:hypothetical protein